MKINYLKIGILLVAFSIPMASCQKDDKTELFNLSQQESRVEVVTYSVNGVIHHAVIAGEQSMKELFDYLLALARNGETVCVFSGNQPIQASNAKDTVIYTTTDENDANRWAREMRNQGYQVEIKFDGKTGIYTCTAIN